MTPSEGDFYEHDGRKYKFTNNSWRIHINNAPQSELFIPWAALKDKPVEFPTEDHAHEISDVRNLEEALSVLTNKTKKLLTGSFTGTLKPIDAAARWYAPADMKVTRIWATVGIPSTSQIKLGVKKNAGVPTVVVIDSASYISETVAPEDLTLVGLTDYLTISITDASGGSDVTICVEYEVAGV